MAPLLCARPERADELLHDDGGVEGAQRNPENRRERIECAEHGPQRAGVNRLAPDDRGKTQGPAHGEVEHDRHGQDDQRSAERALQGLGARLLPAEQRAHAHQDEQQRAQRLNPRLVERRPDRDLLARQRLADERERRRDEDEEAAGCTRIQLLSRNVNSREKNDSMCGRRGRTSSPRVIRRKTISSATYTARAGDQRDDGTRASRPPGASPDESQAGHARADDRSSRPITAAKRSRAVGGMSRSSGQRHMTSVAANAISSTRKTAK